MGVEIFAADFEEIIRNRKPRRSIGMGLIVWN